MQQTKHIYIRLINEKDIDFLLELRLNQNLSKYLGQVDNDKEKQLFWLRDYKLREAFGSDYYFIISDKLKGDLGLVRIYNIDYSMRSFTWGSWVIREENRPKYAAIESALLSYEFAFNELNLLIANFTVDKKNIHATKFYNRFGAKHVYTDEINHHFELSRTRYIQLKYSSYYHFFIG